jgi:hypothetical protein
MNETSLRAAVESADSAVIDAGRAYEAVFEELLEKMADDYRVLISKVSPLLLTKHAANLQALSDDQVKLLKSELAGMTAKSLEVVSRICADQGVMKSESSGLSGTVRGAYWKLESEINDHLMQFGLPPLKLPKVNPKSSDQRGRIDGAMFNDGWSDQFAYANEKLLKAFEALAAAVKKSKDARYRLTQFQEQSRWDNA